MPVRRRIADGQNDYARTGRKRIIIPNNESGRGINEPRDGSVTLAGSEHDLGVGDAETVGADDFFTMPVVIP